jgi:hypothetical protein
MMRMDEHLRRLLFQEFLLRIRISKERLSILLKLKIIELNHFIYTSLESRRRPNEKRRNERT